jgi:hypothetical protein
VRVGRTKAFICPLQHQLPTLLQVHLFGNSPMFHLLLKISLGLLITYLLPIVWSFRILRFRYTCNQILVAIRMLIWTVYTLIFDQTAVINVTGSQLVNIQFSRTDVRHYLPFKLLCILLLTSLNLYLVRSYYLHTIFVRLLRSFGLDLHDFVIGETYWRITSVTCVTTILRISFD